jgi:hypothetical protein
VKGRFEKNMNRHQGLEWAKLQARLEAKPEKLRSLNEMERTGGEPDVVGHDEKADEYFFCDCSAESPSGRRSLRYDREGLESKKEHRPENSAIAMAAAMGIELLTHKQRICRELIRKDQDCRQLRQLLLAGVTLHRPNQRIKTTSVRFVRAWSRVRMQIKPAVQRELARQDVDEALACYLSKEALHGTRVCRRFRANLHTPRDVDWRSALSSVGNATCYSILDEADSRSQIARWRRRISRRGQIRACQSRRYAPATAGPERRYVPQSYISNIR